MKQKLPLSHLLFFHKGRINRSYFILSQVFIWSTFYVIYNGYSLLLNKELTLFFYPVLFWALFCTAKKRLHDRNKSAYFLLFTLLPVFGPLWLFFQLAVLRGNKNRNKYGLPIGHKEDYFENPKPSKLKHGNEYIVNDITGLNPILVDHVYVPKTIEEIQTILATNEHVSIGGGRFSMGGQTASKNTAFIDLRKYNKILSFNEVDKTICVESGIRWCDIQKYIDPHHLSIKIMQSYANFTVGGSLSVNAHGRYLGLGPVILSVTELTVLLADGTIQTTSRNENSVLFNAVIGGYNGLGIILTVTLQLTHNTRIKRSAQKMPISSFLPHFQQNVVSRPKGVLFNADIYPPHYKTVNSVIWEETDEKATKNHKLIPLKESYPLERHFIWEFSETTFGKWRREHIIDPILFARKKIHWRNYEAGYDVFELEPKSRENSTFALREYFVPIDQFDTFSAKMREILIRHRVNIINISIRHAIADHESMLAWAKEECFAFVLFYKQRTRENAKNRVAVWTRELNDAAISCNGSFYLPYQICAPLEQVKRAYPKFEDFLVLKAKIDPNYKFRNQLWNYYYKPEKMKPSITKTKLHEVMQDTVWSDKMYLFLQAIFNLFPEDRFHLLLKESIENGQTEEEVYHFIQSNLKKISPPFSAFTYALPSLKKQKKVIAEQCAQLIGTSKPLKGYVEIGSTGRYINALKKVIPLEGTAYTVNDIAPSYQIPDLFERGQIKFNSNFIALDYFPLNKHIPLKSTSLVTCFIGLHHCPLELLPAFIQSIHDILSDDGLFILRDHDCDYEEMVRFADVIHTVFNIGTQVSFEQNQNEFRNFQSMNYWIELIEKAGFRQIGEKLLQKNDPSINTLVMFQKQK